MRRYAKIQPLLDELLTLFIGTWADRCTSSKGTVVQEMISLIADTEDQEPVLFYVNGIGTGSHWIEKIVAGRYPINLHDTFTI